MWTMTEIDSNSRPVLRLSEPEDLLSAIPYLLKYHPTDSLVFLLLSGRRLVLTARIGHDPEEELEGAAIGRYLSRLCTDHDADGVILVAYCADPGEGSALLIDVMMALESVMVHHALVADGSRWWSCLCDHDEDDCDCDAGTVYDSTSSAVAAQAVLAGISPMPSRDALAESVAGPSDATDRAAAATAIEGALSALSDLDLGERCDRMAILVERHCMSGGPLTGEEYAELAVLAYEGAVRDVAVARMRPDDAAAHVALWRQVVDRTVAPFESAPLCLLGLAAWISGNGALQVVCMERAERINPNYSLLRILDEINNRALPPSVWDELRSA